MKAELPTSDEATLSDLPTPNDTTFGGLISWALFILCGAIAALWRLNESKSATAIIALDARLIATEFKHEERLSAVMQKHEDCEKSREALGCKLAVLEDRMKLVETKMKAD